ncbi:MAG: hypothetical protein II838_10125 [Lachnospiraceae bacterium]|nr:hypothetical protein [Lachnospiraceae bacterium]
MIQVKAAEQAGEEASVVSEIDKLDDAMENLKKWKKSDVVELKITKTGETGKIGESGRYSETEIKSIIDNLQGDGFKNNPLRQAYESEVAGLKAYGDELLASGMSEEQVARTLNQARRDLGIKYKNATPQPLRDYIYEVNMGRYGDKLGPTYDWLVSEKGATNMEIINSSSRPNANIDKLLSGFEEWLRRQWYE